MPVLHLGEQLDIHFIDDNPTGKPAVLLIHGLGVTGESWGFQLPALISAGYRAVAPDLRGHGNSGYLGSENCIDELAADMAALLDHLEIPAAHIIGISLGGAVAIQLAIDYPQLVDKLVLVNTFAHLRPRNLPAWLFYLARGTLIGMLGITAQGKLVGNHMFPGDDLDWLRQRYLEQLRRSNPIAYRSTVRAILQFNVYHRLSEIRTSTLVLTGELDDTVPLDVQQQLVERIPNARQVIVPGGRHAMTVVQTEFINRHILDFLAG